MKKIVGIILIATSLLAVAFFGFNCNKKITCETCSMRKSTLIKDITYHSESKNILLEKTGLWVYNKPNIQENGETQINDLTAADFYLTTTNPALKNKPFLISLYLDKRISEDGLFSFENIKAISNFTVDGNMIQHDFYLKVNNQFVKEDNLSLRITIISDNAIEFIRNNIVFSNSDNTTVLSISLGKPIQFKTPNKVDYLMKAAKRMVKIGTSRNNSTNLIDISYYILPNPEDLTSNCLDRYCNENKPNNICIRDYEHPGYPPQFRCEPVPKGQGGSCLRDDYKTAIENEGAMSSDSIAFTFDDSLHYNTKTFLSNLAFGQKYVYFYYFLGDIYKSNISLSLMLKTTRVLYQFNSKLEMLLNPSSHQNDTLIDSRFKAILLDLFNDYRQVYKDDYVNAIFQNIEDDLNWAEGKSVPDIITGLN